MRAGNVRAVLKALSSDQPVDWQAAESSAGDEDSLGLLRELQVIAKISAVHQNPQANQGASQSRVLTFSRSAETTAASELRWGQLVIRGRLGSGADGEVHRAFDERLQREVALKVLRQTHNAPGVARFLNEARLLARVRHTNVVTVHGADVISGQAGIWMELIAGSTLQELISKQGTLAAHEAALIGAELCRGLAAIHQAGILHRDIKAQNVMRETGGRIVLMDFSVSAADSDHHNLAGTPLYLAPELLEGRPASAQSDIYSVGVLLYYLVTGAYPIAGSSVVEIARAHQDGRKTRLRDARADLPPSFVAAVDRALAADPAQRPQSAGEFEDLLMQSLPRQATNRDVAPAPAAKQSRGWMIAAVVAAMVMLGAAAVGRWPLTFGRPAPPVAVEARPWILVAAFDNRTGDRDLDGVFEYALERELVSSAQVRVASRPRVDDALRLMRKPLAASLDAATAREVALRDGNIRTLIQGRVERIGPLTVLTASVVDVQGGAVLASLAEEVRETGELPQAVRRLSDRLRKTLGEAAGSISLSARQLERVTTPSLKALRLYSEAYAAGERDSWPAAMALAGQAIEADPTFAAAHTWLAWTMFRNREPKDVYVAEAARAMDLAGTTSDWERMWITASYYSLNGEEDRAVPAYEALVRLYPDHFWGVNNLVGQYRRLRRDADAVALAERLVELRPHDYDALYLAFDQLQRTGNLERGKEYARRIRSSGVYDRDPSGDAWVFAAFVAWHDAKPDESMHELAEVQAEATHLDRELRDAILRRTSMSWLALGRPADARTALASVLPSKESHLVEAAIAEASGDLPLAHRETQEARVTEFSRGVPNFADLNQWAMGMWLFVRSGAVNDSATLAATAGPAARAVPNPAGIAIAAVLAAEAATARGAFDDTVRTMRDVRWEALGPRTVLQARDILAEALAHRGERDAAIEVLRPVKDVKHLAAYDRGIWWLRCQVRLAELLQALGRRDESQMIAKELQAMLAEAEPGFPIADRVRALLSPAR